VDIAFDARPKVIRCHPNRADILAIGMNNGSIVFLNTSTL